MRICGCRRRRIKGFPSLYEKLGDWAGLIWCVVYMGRRMVGYSFGKHYGAFGFLLLLSPYLPSLIYDVCVI